MSTKFFRANHSLIGAKHVRFDGVQLDDVFIIDEILLQILPDVVSTTQESAGRNGDHFLGGRYGVRSGQMRVSLNTRQHGRIDSLAMFKKAAGVFISDEPKKLDFGHFYVYARFTNSSDYDQVGIFGSTTLDFVCYDPYMYFDTLSTQISAGENLVYCSSPCSVLPVLTLTGCSAPLEIKNVRTEDKVVISAGISDEKTILIDMEHERCEIDGAYLPVDNMLTDFFGLDPGENLISISSGHGSIEYVERAL